MDTTPEHPSAVPAAEFGYRMEYPTAAEVHHYLRELSWEERIEIYTLAAHRGPLKRRCYSLKEFRGFLARMDPRNPASGLLLLDQAILVPWLRDVIGDTELAASFNKAFERHDALANLLDTLRSVLTSRLNQYYEVVEEEEGSSED